MRASAPARSAGARSSRRSGPTSGSGRLRGNIETRLRKREELGYDAVVVAFAALQRLGLADGADSDVLDAGVMLPQVAQGALAAECRTDDARTLARLRAVDDPVAHRAVAAERAFLAELGGGCDLPCGALAEVDTRGGHDRPRGVARVARRSHRCCARAVAGAEPLDVGVTAARDLLDGKGGRALLDDVA